MRWNSVVVLFLASVAAEASSPADAVARACQDIKTVPAHLQGCTRYRWVVKPSARFRAVEQLRQNLLSRYSEIVTLAEVEPWLWRVRLDEPGWDPGTWENAADTDPFFHFEATFAKETTLLMVWPGGHSRHDGGKLVKRQRYQEVVKAGGKKIVGAPWLPAKELVELRELTWSESPVLMAEWLFVQSSRQRNLLNRDDSGVGYYDWLRLETLDDYFQLVDPKSDLLKGSRVFGREFMAVIGDSGISPQERQLFRYQARSGGVWATFDTDVQKGRGIALKNLRRPDIDEKDQRGRFKFNAQEWYGHLPNRGPVVFLDAIKDGKAVRQSVAPGDTHGLHDKSTLNEGNSATLHILLSCLQCHHPKVLKPFSDDARRKYRKGGWTALGSTDPNQDLEFRRLLLSDVYTQLDEDERLYAGFFEKATANAEFPLGLEVGKAVAWYSRQWHSYGTDRVGLKQAARELGVAPEAWLKALRNYAKPFEGGSTLADSALDDYLQEKPGSLSRLTWEDGYSFAQQILAQQRTRDEKEGAK